MPVSWATGHHTVCLDYGNFATVGFDGCHLGEDVSPWSITWPPTGRNKKAKQKCPGGSESKGTCV